MAANSHLEVIPFHLIEVSTRYTRLSDLVGLRMTVTLLH